MKDCATDQGLRFDGDVPIERIELSPAGLNDQNRDQYEIIGEKITRRLAQQTGQSLPAMESEAKAGRPQ